MYGSAPAAGTVAVRLAQRWRQLRSPLARPCNALKIRQPARPRHARLTSSSVNTLEAELSVDTKLLAVCGSRAALDEADRNRAIDRVQIVQDAVSTDSAPPTEAVALETDNIAGEGVVSHLMQRRAQPIAFRRGNASYCFFGFP